MANYGIPYMGSKDSIVHKICSIFPKADNFYDLFGGGFSISHYMLSHKSKNYKHFYFNEPAQGVVDLIKDAVAGKFNYKIFKPAFIGREEFCLKKDGCAYTRLLWSFGNNQKDYIFGKDIEAHKKSLHNAVIFNAFDNVAIKAMGISKFPEKLSVRGRRFFIRKAVKERVGGLEQLEQLQQLERLQQLQRLERLQRLEFSCVSYEKVEIKPNSIIYCDPPYKGTEKYLTEFDHDGFWKWVSDNKNPVFVSEYSAPNHIKPILAIRKKARLSAGSPTESVEKLFGNDAAFEALGVQKAIKLDPTSPDEISR